MLCESGDEPLDERLFILLLPSSPWTSPDVRNRPIDHKNLHERHKDENRKSILLSLACVIDPLNTWVKRLT